MERASRSPATAAGDGLVGPPVGASPVLAGQRAARHALPVQPRRFVPGDAGFNSIKLWDGTTGEYRFLIRGASSDMAFTPDGGTDRRTERCDHHEPCSRPILGREAGAGRTRSQGEDVPVPRPLRADGRQVVDSEGTILDTSTGAIVGPCPS